MYSSLWLGDNALIEQYDGLGSGVYTATTTLEPGQHYSLYFNFVEQGGPANVQLAWIPPGGSQEVIGQQWLRVLPYSWAEQTSQGMPADAPIAGNATGLRGDYYAGRRFEQPVLTRVDSSVNFAWSSSSPDATVSSDNFSVLWRG